jgi:hydroxyacylglutathione hydrolase
LHLVPLPALADNYIWLMHDDEGNAIVVDPGDAAVAEQALAARRLRLRAILLTHHHPDHVGGAAALHIRHGAPVYAPLDARIDGATERVQDGDLIQLAAPQVVFEVIAVPGHTLSHVAFAGAGVLFCGDTLFSLGCGRLFEGTPTQMLASLDRLSTLPPDTLVCAGHEYTEANGRFARTVEPDNHALQKRLHDVAQLRARHLPTLPVALVDELASNPFLRIDTDALDVWGARHGVGADRIARFAALREAKNGFAG